MSARFALHRLNSLPFHFTKIFLSLICFSSSLQAADVRQPDDIDPFHFFMVSGGGADNTARHPSPSIGCGTALPTACQIDPKRGSLISSTYPQNTFTCRNVSSSSTHISTFASYDNTTYPNSLGSCVNKCSVTTNAIGSSMQYYNTCYPDKEFAFNYTEIYEGKTTSWQRDSICPPNYTLVNLNDRDDLVCRPKQAVSKLGKPDRCETDGAAYTAYPVNLSNGNKYFAHTDYASNRSHGLSFTRYYNSFTSPGLQFDYGYKHRPLGDKWTHTYLRQISPAFKKDAAGAPTNVLNHVMVVREDGKTLRYTPSTNTAGAIVFTAASGGLDNQLFQITDSSGQRTGWRYITADNIEETYDANGRLIRFSGRDGLVTRLTYRSSTGTKEPADAPTCAQGSTVPVHAIQCVTDAWGRQLHFNYDGATKQLTKLITPKNETINYTYTTDTWYASDDAFASSWFKSVPNSLGKHQLQQILLQTITYPDNHKLQYSYSAFSFVEHGLIKKVSETINDTTTLINTLDVNYDAATGKVSSETIGNGLFQTVIESSGSVKTGDNYLYHAFDNKGNLVEDDSFTRRYDSVGNLTQLITKGINSSRISTYDARNLEISRVESLISGSDPTAQNATITWHATWRLPLTVTEIISLHLANGTYVSDARRINTFTYDAQGRPIQHLVTIKNAQGTLLEGSRTTTYTYDGILGQIGQITHPNGAKTLFAYHTVDGIDGKIGDLKTVTNPLGHVTTFNAYDANGRAVRVTDPNGVVTTLNYDSRGRIVTQTLTSGTNNRITRFTWNGQGSLTQITAPDNSVTTFTYDAAKRITAIKDAAGNQLRYAWNASNNLVASDHVNKAGAITWRREWKYNPQGQVTQDRRVRGNAPTLAVLEPLLKGLHTSANSALALNKTYGCGAKSLALSNAAYINQLINTPDTSTETTPLNEDQMKHMHQLLTGEAA